MLASDLKEYGKCYSTDQLKRMARFACCFSESEISAQAVHQSPWSTIIELIRLSSSIEEALWYVGQITKNKWSRSHGLKQFELLAYLTNLVGCKDFNTTLHFVNIMLHKLDATY